MLARTLLLAVALGLSVASTSAQAGTFQLSPTRLDLAARGSSGSIAITNTSDQPMRLQLSASAWDQSPTGEQLLGKTGDLVVFPTMLTIAPRETRRVKAGINVDRGARERTYRLIIEELPPPAAAPSTTGLRVLMRMSVPIFQKPLREVRGGAVSHLVRRGELISFDVENHGSMSAMLKRANVTAKDASGAVVWKAAPSGWYLLAGGKRSFSLTVPAEQAAQISRVEVEAETNQGTWKATPWSDLHEP